MEMASPSTVTEPDNLERVFERYTAVSEGTRNEEGNTVHVVSLLTMWRGSMGDFVIPFTESAFTTT